MERGETVVYKCIRDRERRSSLARTSGKVKHSRTTALATCWLAVHIWLRVFLPTHLHFFLVLARSFLFSRLSPPLPPTPPLLPPSPDRRQTTCRDNDTPGITADNNRWKYTSGPVEGDRQIRGWLIASSLSHPITQWLAGEWIIPFILSYVVHRVTVQQAKKIAAK